MSEEERDSESDKIEKIGQSSVPVNPNFFGKQFLRVKNFFGKQFLRAQDNPFQFSLQTLVWFVPHDKNNISKNHPNLDKILQQVWFLS